MDYIACFGDSLVQGFPFGKRHSWTAAVESDGQITMLNYGLCGDCCDDILARMKMTALPDYVKHIVFLGGANDILQKRPQKFILADLEKVLLWCEENNKQVLIILPFISSDEKFNVHLLALRAAIAETFGKRAELLDLQPAIGLTQAERERAYLDCVHPKSETYAKIGEYALPYLKKWLEQTK